MKNYRRNIKRQKRSGVYQETKTVANILVDIKTKKFTWVGQVLQGIDWSVRVITLPISLNTYQRMTNVVKDGRG